MKLPIARLPPPSALLCIEATENSNMYINEIQDKHQSIVAYIKENLLDNKNLSIRGLGGLCEVAHTSIIRDGAFGNTKLAQIMSEHGFEAGALALNGFNAQTTWLVIEHFAFESKAKALGAKRLARTFGAFGIHQLFEQIIKPKTKAELILEQAQQLVNLEREQELLKIRSQEHERRIALIEQHREQALEELEKLPFSTEPASPLTVPLRGSQRDRDKINEIIRAVAQRDSIPYGKLYSKAYKQLYYREHYDAGTRAKNSGLSKIEQVEKDGMTGKLYAIVSEIYV